MSKHFIYLIASLLVGCNGMVMRSEAGAGSSLFFNSIPRDEVASRVGRVGVYFGKEIISISNNFKVDGFIGPSAEYIDGGRDGKAGGFGGDVLGRLRFSYWESIEPYFGVNAGPHYYPGGIGNQATDWGFILGGGPGVRIKITDKTWLTGEYRAFHESNGSKVFGSPEPNPGFNADLAVVGLEYQF